MKEKKKRDPWDDPEFAKFYQTIEENDAWYIPLFMIVFILLLSLGIAELVVWFLCTITGVPFSLLLGFAGWLLFLVVRYNIVIRVKNEE